MVDLILPGEGAGLIRALDQRRGQATRLRLRNGREVVAYNCAWGMAYAARWEHLTLNLSPRVPGAEVEQVSSADVLAAIEPMSGRAIYERASDDAR